MSSSTSTTNGIIAWVQASDKIVVGDGTSAIEFAPSTYLTNSQTASYTLTLADKDKLIEMNVASANTVTIPTNTSVAFPIGTQITVLQTGAGATSIVVTAGVTLNATPQGTANRANLRATWSSVTLIKRGTDTWVALGDLQS